MICVVNANVLAEEIEDTPILILDQEQTATISLPGEEVYFKFVPTVSGYYSFFSSATTDTYAYLYDSSFEYIYENDDGGNEYNFNLSYELEAGEIYYFGVCLWNEEETNSFPVKITKAPTVTSVVVKPTKVVENYHGYYKYYGDDFDTYFYYDWYNSLIYTVTFSDGSTAKGLDTRILTDDGTQYYINFEDNQDYFNQWTKGNTYNCTIDVLGYKATVPVTIVDCPVKSIEVQPIYVDYRNSYEGEIWIYDEDDYEDEGYPVYYTCYEWRDKLNLKINFENGTSQSFKWADLYLDDFDTLEYDGIRFWVDIFDEQDYYNQWVEGDTYTAYIEVLGYEDTFNITVLDSALANAIDNSTGNTLVYYKGQWYHAVDGQWVNDTTLVYYNGNYWYVKNGILDFKATTLVQYNGQWWYVNGGKINFKANTLVYYNKQYFHVSNGKWVKDTTLVNYNGKWWYVNNGILNFSYNGKVAYGGKWYNVKNGVKV